MKTKKEIMKQTPVFLNNWDCERDVFSDFYLINEKGQFLDKTNKCKVLFASYEIEGYEGNAFVLYKKKNTLYEVNGSTCSYSGLEDQWQEEKVVLKELKNRIINGKLGFADYSSEGFKKELIEFLGI